ncbi:MAG: hypothetical protein K1Y02_24900 [Candidatus Hydrogenedentes bacterium]|nr:hypothetical protein [Candidatus Hydrogenedentota bacterium]
MLESAILDASWVEEPRLVFGNGKLHENPKVGIPLYGPRSYGTPRHKSEVHIGFIGEGDSIQHVQDYIASACEGIQGESYHYTFPGCSSDVGYCFSPRFSPTLVEKVTQTEKAALLNQKRPQQRFEDSVALFLAKLELLCGKDHPLDYVMLVLSEELYEVIRAADYGGGTGLIHRDFRRAFKAGAMKFKKPTQLFRESTIGRGNRQLDNAATRAWNLFTGMYFKAGGLPWGPSGLMPSTCHVGVSFYRPLGDSSSIRASAARAFDENGEGLVLRGQKFEWDEEKMGKSPHLPAEHAARLVEDVLNLYQFERHQLPQRVVIHKTSAFAPAEREGFTSALARVKEYDLVSVFPTSNIRLLRTGKYPPLRGTILNIEDEHYLYTTGYMPTISAFPHGHVPAPLRVVDHVGDTSVKDILREVLILSKMNWNSANMDGLLPITVTFSRIVGDILREVPPDVIPDPKYVFYI